MVASPDLMLKKLPPDSPLQDDLHQIKKSAQNAAAIISDLLTMARRGKYEKIPLQLNDIIRAYGKSQAFQALMEEYGRVGIDYDLAKNLLTISGSESHLTKVVMNLIINGIHSHASSGEIFVRTRNEHIQQRLTLFGKIPEGEYVVFEVEDCGSGISSKKLERIFDPFYTTKSMATGKGTGLGLSIVHGVVRDHGAYIEIDSVEGEGSTFSIYFPAIRLPVQSTAGVQADYLGSESVLIVDDMPVQIELVRQILDTYGYEVHDALGGRAAVKYLVDHKVDLVILDMIMEDGFDGLRTYQEILKKHPDQKALIVTGFSESERVKEAIKIGVGGYINKPYTVQSLGKAVREVLDG
jgi:CheY-like chemotaxis protein